MVETRSQSNKRDVSPSNVEPVKRTRTSSRIAARTAQLSSSAMPAPAQASSSTMAAPAGVSSSSMAQPPEPTSSTMAAPIAAETVSAAKIKGRASKSTAVPKKPTNKDKSKDVNGDPKESEDEVPATETSEENLPAVMKRARASKKIAVPKKPTKEDKSSRENGDSEESSDDKGGAIGLDLGLPPVHKIEHIFQDITDKALTLGLEEALEYFDGHTIRIGTMCSGTESPILALELVKKALASRGHTLEFQHVFSAEIEPYKQAYIERNFHTSTIFRDVRELALQDSASTAYGANQAVPIRGEIDIVVAGFACVDFSNLNRNRKGLDGKPIVAEEKPKPSKPKGPDCDEPPPEMPTAAQIEENLRHLQEDTERGESGDTLHAIVAFAARCRPPIVLLENILHAPWEKVQTTFNQIGYMARFIKMDTKQYYIPHTRQRVYMLCLDTTSNAAAWDMTREWTGLVKQFKRRASVPVDAFLLPESDPRLAEAKAEIRRAKEKSKGPWKWLRGQIRHLKYREDHGLGSGRPITRWMENGSSTMLDYADMEWTRAQVDRIKDYLELYWLHAAKCDYDPAYKPRYPDLSQNIDRSHPCGGWGTTGCITPSGMPFSSTRGGPVVGYESLSLQGIPIENLLLTQESQRQLQDLAGNAMTSTVVGVTLISALIVAHRAIPLSGRRFEEISDERTIGRVLVRDSLSRSTHIPFGPLITTVGAAEICAYARVSAQYCGCETQGTMTPLDTDIYRCIDCAFTACVRCAGVPRHRYHRLRASEQLFRIQPTIFREHIKDFLPMRLQLSGEMQEMEVEDRIGPVWRAFRGAAYRALQNEYRFSSAQRFNFWTICYEGPVSRLELELTDEKAQWLLYGKPDPQLPANAKLRKLLEKPIAAMTTDRTNIFRGQWRLCNPVTYKFDVTVEGCGAEVPSWKARLGLVDHLDDKVWSAVEVRVAENSGCPELDIAGTFTFLPDCGTANSSLHKRASTASTPTKYLFLDPARVGEPKHDHFVIATSHRRLRYGEHRMIDVSLGLSSAGEGNRNWVPNSHVGPQTVRCTAKGEWIPADINLTEPLGGIATAATLQTSATISDVIAPACQDSNVVALACDFAMLPEELPDWPDGWAEIDKTNEQLRFAQIAWMTERVRRLKQFSEHWREIDGLVHQAPCDVCSPRRPAIKWKWGNRGQRAVVMPYEDAAEAGPYERKVKSRPVPIATRLKFFDGKGQVEVSINVLTLAHRALARLMRSRLDPSRQISVAWKLNTTFDAARRPNLPPLTLPDNKNDPRRAHVFVRAAQPGRALRKEQQRSLSWMVRQESANAAPFLEEEVEEAVMGPLGWRLQARAVCPRLARGGVLADKVGYGKTITTLALIDTQAATATSTPVQGYIELKGTLILAPNLLVNQWVQEIEEFLGEDCKVLVIKHIEDFEDATIANFQSADIILVSHDIMSNEQYVRAMSCFAARPEPPTALGGRAFAVWLHEAETKIKEHVEELKRAKCIRSFAEQLETRRKDAEQDEELRVRIPSKRLKGQAYIKSKAQGKAKASTTTLVVADIDDDLDGESDKDGESEEDGEPEKDGESDEDGNSGEDGESEQDDGDEDSDPVPPKKKVARTAAKPKPKIAKPPAKSTKTVAKPPVKPTKTVARTPAMPAPAQPEDYFGFEKAKGLGSLIGAILQIFVFERLIVDEFTYLSERDHTEVVSLQAKTRWILSGTPDLDNFLGVKGMADLIGVNIGDDDGRDVVVKGRSIASGQINKTAAEVFGSFVEAQSSDWHEHRHALAQSFLNQFARQNVAEIKDIDSESLYIATEQHLGERAVYLELQTQLYGQDMRHVQGGNGSSVDSDYLNRLHEMITTSKSPEEALLRRCSLFQVQNPSGGNGEIQVLDNMISTREEQLDEHRQIFLARLGEAAVMKQLCGQEDTHYQEWRDLVKRNKYGDHDASKEMLGMICDAEQSLTPPDGNNARKATTRDVEKLREKKDLLNELALQYVGRMRMCRFLHLLREVQQWSNTSQGRQAACCREPVNRVEDLCVLTVCGHPICKKCLSLPGRPDTCGYKGCNGPALEYHAIDTADLINRATTVPGPIHYGTKIADLVKLVEKIIGEDAEDRILLFVQYPDVMKAIQQAFVTADIPFATITGAPSKAKAESDAIDSFRGKGVGRAKKVSVLILNASTSCASGHNLTKANHVVFVSPFLASSKHDYDQLYEQAVGRAKRYGQHKTVFAYHMVCLGTIDVNTIEDASGKKIVHTDDQGGIDLVDPAELTAEEAAQDNSTVRFQGSRAIVGGDDDEAEEEPEHVMDAARRRVAEADAYWQSR